MDTGVRVRIYDKISKYLGMTDDVAQARKLVDDNLKKGTWRSYA